MNVTAQISRDRDLDLDNLCLDSRLDIVVVVGAEREIPSRLV